MRRLIAIVVVLGILGFLVSRGMDWWNYNVNTPVSASGHGVIFHIDPGETPSQIGNDLYDLGLIRSTVAFDLYTRLHNAGPKFEAGTFQLNNNMTLAQIVEALQHGRPDQISITFKEGFPLREQARVVDDKKLATISGSAYLQAAKDPALAATYKFLPTQTANADFPYEGYLFPDTYLFDLTARAKDLVQAQLAQFSVVFSADWRAQIGQATSARPAEDIRTIVILASMVDREANEKTPTDRGNVCSVYYNRLKINMPLGVDATLLYALGRLSPEPTGTELALDTPFNTRKHAGLPPGPISNPGKAALNACINPPKTDHLFYFKDRQGTTHIETNDRGIEHNKAKFSVGGN